MPEAENAAVAETPSQEASEMSVAQFEIIQTKEFRVALDVVLQRLKDAPRKSRERSLAVTKIQEAIMWLGMDLKDLGNENPYPNSYNVGNAIVEPTADGLKL